MELFSDEILVTFGKKLVVEQPKTTQLEDYDMTDTEPISYFR